MTAARIIALVVFSAALAAAEAEAEAPPPYIARDLEYAVALAERGAAAVDAEALRDACALLAQPRLIPWVARERDRLLPALALAQPADRDDVLGLLDPPRELIEPRLGVATDPVLARLGDAEAERRVIAGFAEATDLHDIEHRALKLLYVDTPAAWAALAARLGEATMVEETDTDPRFPRVHLTDGTSIVPGLARIRTAVAYVVLRACSTVWGHLDAFSRLELPRHVYVGPEEFAEPAHQNHLRGVEAWFARTHGIALRIRAPAFVHVTPIEP